MLMIIYIEDGFHVGPLLDDWLKGETPKALKGLPL